MEAFGFLFFLWGPCAVLFCSDSLPFHLHLARLWSMSQHLRGWNSRRAGITEDGFLKAEPPMVLAPPLNDNFFCTNTMVTACSLFRSLQLNLRDAFLILGWQLNCNNCWQVVWKGCLSSEVFGFSRGGCVGWSVTAVSHTTNSFFKRLFFIYWYGIFLNLHLEILVLALNIVPIFKLKYQQHWICNYFFPAKNVPSHLSKVLFQGMVW